MHKSLKTRLGVKESHSEWLRSRLTLMQAIERCNVIAICSVDSFVDWSCKTFVEMVLLVSVCPTEAQYLLHFIWHDRFTSVEQLVPQRYLLSCLYRGEHFVDLLSVCLIGYICQQIIVCCHMDPPMPEVRRVLHVDNGELSQPWWYFVQLSPSMVYW